MKEFFYFSFFCCFTACVISIDIALNVNGEDVYDDELELLWNNTNSSSYVFDGPSLNVNGEDVYDEELELLWNDTSTTTDPPLDMDEEDVSHKALKRQQRYSEYLELTEGEILSATINDYTDKLLGNVNDLFKAKGVDPLSLPDLQKNISKKILFINYRGSIDLSYISVEGLSTIRREGDSIVSYDVVSKKLTLDVSLELDKVNFTSHLRARLPPFSSTGRLTGAMTNIKITASVEIDFQNMQASVLKCEVTDSGEITVHFHVGKLVDWFMNIIADSAAASLKPSITESVEKILSILLEDVVDVINKILL